MNKLSILRFPDPRLRTIAKNIYEFNQSVIDLVEDMYHTMYEEKGVGLAATQVNQHLRVIVTDCGKATDDEDQHTASPIEFINPEIIVKSNETEISQEGCLSVPDIYADINRHKNVTVKAFDRFGKAFTMECTGLLAVCIQHEIDHLNGKLFVDYLSAAKRQIIRNKMKKYEKSRLKEQESINHD